MSPAGTGSDTECATLSYSVRRIVAGETRAAARAARLAAAFANASAASAAPRRTRADTVGEYEMPVHDPVRGAGAPMRSWYVHRLGVGRGYVAALAVEGNLEVTIRRPWSNARR